MDTKFYVYQLRDPRCELPFYIGKGFGNRAYDHFNLNGSNNRHKNNTIKKIVREGYEVQVEFIKADLTEDDAFLWEIFYIAEYGRSDLGLGPLTNLTDGGEGSVGYQHTDSVKQQLREQAYNRSEETKKKISEGLTGRKFSGERISKAKSKDWQVHCPDGSEIRVTNMTQFCKDNGLDQSSMSMVARGIRPHHKGYRCIRIN